MTDEKEKSGCSACDAVDTFKKRVRGITSMSLDWLAERFRKTEKVKEKLAEGNYTVDSDAIAKAILNDEKK